MAIPSGTKLGLYEVRAQIGAGGMGEVYQAHDTMLGRDVAIKVLPEAFAHDAERLARFQREAKMLAALNHPNIATIFGLEHSDGVRYLVMELVPGATLQERLMRDGVIPIEEALKIAAQIAEALEAAHEKSIIHRDLKPANVKVTTEGKVKVLDFGLAKAFEADASDGDLANSPTLTQAATMQGVILGTAAYMSPEQARGKSVDKRTDLWAFGCVLYEMLTGKQTFHGETTTDIIAKILTAEPDWQTLPPTVPTQICVLLKRCLQKEKTLRLRDAGDARIEIQEALASPAPAVPMSVVPRRLRSWQQVALLGAAAVALLAIGGFAAWNLRPAPAQPITRTVINLPTGQQLADLENGPAIALSPDGTHLAYVAREGGTQRLYLRAMDSLESKPIAGTEGAVGPFFSPDGQWVGFFAGEKLKKVSVNGGAAMTLVNAPSPGGASWSSQGTLAFQNSVSAVGLQQISQEGGTAQPLTQLRNDELFQRWPEFLPNGKAVLSASTNRGFTAWNNARIIVKSAGTGEGKDLEQTGTQPRYAAPGFLLYVQSGTLMAVPFDARRVVLTGPAVPVLEGVMESTITGAAQYSVSSTGTLVYLAGAVAGTQSRMVWVSRNGEEQLLPAAARSYLYPRISPDGRRVAVAVAEQESQIWIYDIPRDTLTRLTFEGNMNDNATWSIDGKRIAFTSNRGGGGNLFWEAADGSGGAERLTASDYLNTPTSFSPDAQLLAFIETTPQTNRDIWVLRMGDRKAQPFLRTRNEETAPKFSPDGKWLAYSSDESGRREIYVQPYPGPGGKWQISTDGGQEPVWNPNGRELFYRSGTRMMAVDVDTKPGFLAGKPRMLFEGPYLPTGASLPYYDISPDGQRFLMLKPVESRTSAPTQINVVLNWTEELKQRVPAGTK